MRKSRFTEEQIVGICRSMVSVSLAARRFQLDGWKFQGSRSSIRA